MDTARNVIRELPILPGISRYRVSKYKRQRRCCFAFSTSIKNGLTAIKTAITAPTVYETAATPKALQTTLKAFTLVSYVEYQCAFLRSLRALVSNQRAVWVVLLPTPVT